MWRIAFSAFFADLGYEMVVTGLPIFLVLSLGAPVWVYGVAGNLSMSLLYQLGPQYAYGYAALGALAAALVVALWARPRPQRLDAQPTVEG